MFCSSNNNYNNNDIITSPQSFTSFLVLLHMWDWSFCFDLLGRFLAPVWRILFGVDSLTSVTPIVWVRPTCPVGLSTLVHSCVEYLLDACGTCSVCGLIRQLYMSRTARCICMALTTAHVQGPINARMHIFEVNGECEASVHWSKRFLQDMAQDSLLVKLDF